MIQFAVDNPVLTLVLCIIGGAVLTCIIAGTAGLGAGTFMANILYGTLGGAIGAVIGTFLVGGFSPGQQGEPGSPAGEDQLVSYTLVIHMERERLKLKLVDNESATPRRYESSSIDQLPETVLKMRTDLDNLPVELSVEFQTSVPEAIKDSVIEELRNHEFLCRF